MHRPLPWRFQNALHHNRFAQIRAPLGSPEEPQWICVRRWVTGMGSVGCAGPRPQDLCRQAGGPGRRVVLVSPSPKAREPGAPLSERRMRRVSQLKKGERIHPFFLLLVLPGPSEGWVKSTHGGRGSLVCPPVQTLMSSGSFLGGTPTDGCFPSALGGLSWDELTQKMRHHRLLV